MNKATAILGLILSVFFITTSAQSIRTGENKNLVGVKVNTDKKLVIRNTLSGIDVRTINTDKGNFIRLNVDGYTPSSEIGEPLIPVSRNIIEVPLKASFKIKVKSYKVNIYKLNDLGYKGKLIPVQPPVSKNDVNKKPLIINDKSYSNNGYLTHPLVTVDDLGIMRGVRMARLNISPVIYNPTANTIKVYSDIETEIVFVNGDIEATKAEKQKYYSPYFSTFQSKLLNHKASSPLKDAEIRYPIKYVIVSDPMFQSTLKPFVDWQTKRGFKVVEAYTNDSAVGTTTTSIKSYLQSLYTGATPNDPAPSYVLLVGDVAQIPTFAGTTGTHPTDLYYCEYTGDFLPEVFYGRFSASTTADLEAQIEKTLQYERCEMPDKSYLNQDVLIAGYADPEGLTYGNGQVNYQASTYYNNTTGYTTFTDLFPTCIDSSLQIIQHVSNGVGYANYSAHGSPEGWYSPSFQISDVATLQNVNKYPLMIGNCCLTNKFDETVCFGEALLRAYQKGAIGYIGASDDSYWDEDFYWACGVKTVSANPTYDPLNLGAIDRVMHTHGELFSQWYVTQGQIVQAGDLAVTMSGSTLTDYYWEIYHLMGDPSLMPYFNIPLMMTANYVPLIPLGSTTFNLTTEPYTYVGISKDSTLYGAALADSLGNVTVNLSPITSPGYVNLVITKQNRQPIIDSILAETPSGPYIILNNSQITDFNGNNNGNADYGELIKLNVNLMNVGNAIDTTVYAILTTNDPYVTINDSVKIWDVIASQNSKEIDSAFSFTIKSFIPDQHIALFTLKVLDQSGNNWSYNINVTLNAPALQITFLSINDSLTGNSNGRLDPGETVNVTFKISNTGHCDAVNTNTILTSTIGFINIANPNANINMICKGGSANVTYTISATSAATNGSIYNLTLLADLNPYLFKNTFNNMIGVFEEDFETHNFTKFSWDTTDIYPWTIDTVSYPMLGSYCAKSGKITDNQTTSLSININVVINDSISFFRKVSCEQDPSGNVDYDNLQFLIDGTLIDKWDGEQDWTRVAFPVTSGVHTLTWMYSKDASISSGYDCGWIDNIIFPPFESTLGIPTITGDNVTDFIIYPNPARDNVNLMYKISKEETTSFKIFTTTGACVYTYDKEHQQPGVYSKEIDVSMLDKGIYYCTMLFNDKVITRKFVITK